jgi:hypothetical protein
MSTSTLDFKTLNMKIPNLVSSQYSSEQQKEVYEYLNHLDAHHRKAYEIAFQHLGSSFNICRSNGFKDWKESKKQT